MNRELLGTIVLSLFGIAGVLAGIALLLDTDLSVSTPGFMIIWGAFLAVMSWVKYAS